MDDLKVFEGRQAYDFDKGRERIITTILVEFFDTVRTFSDGCVLG